MPERMTSPLTTTDSGLRTIETVERVCEGTDPVEVHFEPIVDLVRGKACGYEALARFPAHPQLDAGGWFEAAARLGWAGRLEALVVSRALAARSNVPDGCFLSMNLSPAAAASHEMADCLDSEPDLEGVVLEITGQTPITDPDSLRETLGALAARGAKLAVDDVGERYATLEHVVSIRPQFVKIDRTVVQGIDLDPVAVAAVEAVGAFASKVGGRVVAEGVERFEELDTLIRLGVPLAQGFLFGRPAMHMQAVDPVLGEHIRVRAAERFRGTGVHGLLERVPVAFGFEGEEAIRRLFADEHIDWVPVLDERSRPVAMAAKPNGASGPRLEDALTVEADESPAIVARRAMTRAEGSRLTPLVCCDSRGRYVAMLRVERLVETLADSALETAPLSGVVAAPQLARA